jgi:hypothetical protein
MACGRMTVGGTLTGDVPSPAIPRRYATSAPAAGKLRMTKSEFGAAREDV